MRLKQAKCKPTSSSASTRTVETTYCYIAMVYSNNVPEARAIVPLDTNLRNFAFRQGNTTCDQFSLRGFFNQTGLCQTAHSYAPDCLQACGCTL